jgi:4-diphosphocytidyl-2-C-methyl-D-erythritol kinase
MSRALVLRPFAKINLTLRVGRRRPDGFHDVQTLLQSIALSDRLTLQARRGPFVLVANAPGVPSDRANLVYKAAELLWRSAGRAGEPRDVHARLDKQIPAAAGLGGGSADAAAALAGLNALWSTRLDRRALVALAGELGSDVPFFLQGGTALGAGRGNELYPVDDLPRHAVVVIKPSFGVRTAEAYEWLDEDRMAVAPTASGVVQHPSEVEVGWPGGPLVLANDLQGAVVARHEAVGEMLDALQRAGARGVAMTGSGSATFGLFREPVARAALKRLQRPDWVVIVTRTMNRREASRRFAGL